MTRSRQYILDASIAIKRMFDDEEHVAAARSILWGYQAGAISLLAPDHLQHEVLNALRTAVRMERMPAELAEASAVDFLALNIPTAGSPRLYLAGLRVALEFGCAFYDGLYVSLASEAGCELVHADRRLKNVLNGGFERELWIEDFPVDVGSSDYRDS